VTPVERSNCQCLHCHRPLSGASPVRTMRTGANPRTHIGDLTCSSAGHRRRPGDRRCTPGGRREHDAFSHRNACRGRRSDCLPGFRRRGAASVTYSRRPSSEGTFASTRQARAIYAVDGGPRDRCDWPGGTRLRGTTDGSQEDAGGRPGVFGEDQLAVHAAPLASISAAGIGTSRTVRRSKIPIDNSHSVMTVGPMIVKTRDAPVGSPT
jgi:hypothetical protein